MGAEHVTCLGEMRNAHQILVGNPEGKRDHSYELRVDGKIISEYQNGS